MTDDRSKPEFVLDVPDTGVTCTATEHGDIYRPDGEGSLPAVVFVPGPLPPGNDPRQSPLFQGYARLAAQNGLAGVVALQDYPGLHDWEGAADRLPTLVDAIRSLSEVDASRVALWVFSGSGLLMDRWLAQPPSWLRVLALTYPVFRAAPQEVGCPVVLTRAGQERPDWLARVDGLAAHDQVQLIDVPNGRHAFDMLDHTPESRAAIHAAMAAVVEHLR